MGNYFIIDGSALLSQIRQLQKAEPAFKNRKLCPKRFIAHFIGAFPHLHGGGYKRATFYFPKGDESAIDDFLCVPDHRKPGEIEDLHFKFCGYKLKRSGDFDRFVEEMVPPKWHDRFQKSEKGMDIEMCCDALKLASSSKVDRLFLLTNDGDFVPFCRAIKEFGANITIVHLSGSGSPNGELLREADTFSVIPLEALEAIFLAADVSVEEAVAPEAAPAVQDPVEPIELSEKPDAEPSDLLVHEGDRSR